jgi:hypothetical protein
MRSEEAVELLAGVLAAPPDGMDREACTRRLREIARLRGVLGAAEIATSRRLGVLAEQGRGEPVEHSLGRAGGRSAAAAENTRDREQAAGELPGFEDALGEGAVSTEHLDALAMALKLLAVHPELVAEFKAAEAELLEHAASEGVDAFRRRCRKFAKALIGRADLEAGSKERDRQRARANVKTWRDKDTGMWHLHAELDPERGAIVDRMLQQELARLRSQDQDTGDTPLPFMQLKVDALVSAMSTTGDGSPGRALVAVLIDWDHLRGDVAAAADRGAVQMSPEYRMALGGSGELDGDGVLCETIDGNPLHVETVRRLACDADILPAVMDSSGIVKDMGRGARSATPGQKARLSTMHATCVGPECRVPFSKCHIHHVVFWGLLGNTDEEVLVPVCSRHHHDLHEGGYRIQLDGDRNIAWHRPDGTEFWRGSSIDRRDNPNAA